MNPRLRLVVVVGIVTVAACVPAGTARAGTYTVEACLSARQWNYGSAAFELDRSTRLIGVDRTCSPWGRPGRDPALSATVKSGGGRVDNGAYARAIFRAPAGMRIERVEWSGLLKRCDPDWTAGVAVSGDGPGRWVMLPGHNRFTRPCKDDARRSAAPLPASLSNVDGATAIYSQVRCASRDGCAVSALRGGEVRADARTFAARITLTDPTLPEVRITGGELTNGTRWVRGSQEILFTASDNSGISLEEVVSAGGILGNNPRPCNFTLRAPCPGTVTGPLAAQTARANDGAQMLTLKVHDATGQASSIGFPALIDNHPPGPVATSVTGGEGWQRSGPFTVTWQNPPEPAAPITGAYYQLRRAGTERWAPPVPPQDTRNARLDFAVEPGEWDLRVWRVDAAGNASAEMASVPVRLRYDPEVPELGFEAQDHSDPARVSVLARERVSGLATGEIEVRREGEAAWRPVRTELSGTRVVARLDDATLPAGVYALRARASDRAGNVGFSERRGDGFPAVISLPARGRSAMRAGVVTHRSVRRRVRRGRHRRTVRRRVLKLVPLVRARRGRRVVVRGVLTGPSGGPLGNTEMQVSEQPELAPARPPVQIRTGSNGHFRVVMKAARNTLLQVVYPGTTLVLPSYQNVAVRVRAASTMRASRRRVRNGGSVSFAGHVRTLPIPAAGKLLEIQAHFRGRWRTFQTVRTTATGHWRFRYRFGATVGRVRYRFRAMLPTEGDYPYARGASRTVRVTVRG